MGIVPANQDGAGPQSEMRNREGVVTSRHGTRGRRHLVGLFTLTRSRFADRGAFSRRRRLSPVGWGAKNSRLRGRQNGDKGTRREKLSLANDVVMNDYDRQLTTSGKKIRVGETVATYCKLVHFEHVHVYGRRYCDRRFVTTMRRDRR